MKVLSESFARSERVRVVPYGTLGEFAQQADIVLVDPNRKVVPKDEEMESKSAWTPYVDWEFTGAPVLTMLRGTVIAKDGKVLGEPGFGRYIAGRAQDWAPTTPTLHQGLSLEPRLVTA